MATTEHITQTDLERELKDRLVRRIEATHHLGVLRGVLSLLDEIASDGVYVLTPEEKKMIDEAEQEPCISAEEANRTKTECLSSLAKSFS